MNNLELKLLDYPGTDFVCEFDGYCTKYPDYKVVIGITINDKFHPLFIGIMLCTDHADTIRKLNITCEHKWIDELGYSMNKFCTKCNVVHKIIR